MHSTATVWATASFPGRQRRQKNFAATLEIASSFFVHDGVEDKLLLCCNGIYKKKEINTDHSCEARFLLSRLLLLLLL